MNFETTNSKEMTITWANGCTRTRPAKVSRVKSGGCGPITREDVGAKRTGDPPSIYAQALAAGECGPADANQLPQGVAFGKYINAGHIIGDQFGGPMGDKNEETANFFPQNAKNNQGGVWKKLEMCLSVCIQTVPGFEADHVTGRVGGFAELLWELDYPNDDSLYPESVTYKYKFLNSENVLGATEMECWHPWQEWQHPGVYKFDDNLGEKRWPESWKGMKTQATNACNAARNHARCLPPSAACSMFATFGSIKIENKCDAPCGPGSFLSLPC